MKKKLLTILLTIVATFCLCLGLSACGSSSPEHIHSYGAWYSDGATTHSKECVCGDIQTQVHTFSGNTCTRCGYIDTGNSGQDNEQQKPGNGQNTTTSNGLEYSLSANKNYYYVSGIGNCTDTNIVIDSTYNGLPVKYIDSEAFYNCSSIKSIVVPNSVDGIGKGAFSGCSSLVNITLPFVGGSKTATSSSSSTLFGYIFGESSYTGGVVCVQSYNSHSDSAMYFMPQSLKSVTINGGIILYGAFFNCENLTTITLSGSVISIDKYAFFNCSSLKSVKIGNGVPSIGEYAFYNCSKLTSITIPDSVVNIGNSAFRACSSLESITLPFVGKSKTATTYESVFGYIFGYTISSSSDAISGAIYQYCSSAYYYHYYIPTSLTSVTITGSIASIRSEAFKGCSSLTSITIPNSVTSIGICAFYDCTSLTSIIIPDSVTSIGMWAFYNCSSLESVTIGSRVASIGEKAFYNCSSLTIYCEASSRPSGWDIWWNYSGCPVVWGHTGE